MSSIELNNLLKIGQIKLEAFNIILKKAVVIVARRANGLKMLGFFENYFENSSHRYAEKKFSKKPSRFNTVELRSRLQRPVLG